MSQWGCEMGQHSNNVTRGTFKTMPQDTRGFDRAAMGPGMQLAGRFPSVEFYFLNDWLLLTSWNERSSWKMRGFYIEWKVYAPGRDEDPSFGVCSAPTRLPE